MKWSYSSYSAAQQCLQKYKYLYIDEIKPEAPYSGELKFGSALHEAMHSMMKDEDWESVFDVMWCYEKVQDNVYGRYDWKALNEIGIKLLSRFERLHKKKFKPLIMEERFYKEVEGLQLEGTPDFIGEYNGQLALFDWKTAAYNYDKVKEIISLQLYLYSYIYDKPLNKLGYVVFNKGTESIQILEWGFNKEQQKKLLDEMFMFCHKQSRDMSFPKNPNACLIGKNKCEFFDKCWRNK